MSQSAFGSVGPSRPEPGLPGSISNRRSCVLSPFFPLWSFRTTPWWSPVVIPTTIGTPSDRSGIWFPFYRFASVRVPLGDRAGPPTRGCQPHFADRFGTDRCRRVSMVARGTLVPPSTHFLLAGADVRYVCAVPSSPDRCFFDRAVTGSYPPHT